MSSKIVMTVLGAEAVGKTTLLATMYTKLVQAGGKLSLTASDNAGADLTTAYGKLAKISNEPNFKPVGRLLEGNQGIIEHQFEILFKNRKILDLSFYDMAGGIVLEKDDSKDFQEFKKILTQKATVIVNVVDGAALMKGSELYSEKVNRPTRIRDLLLPALSEKQQPHLVLFVITKCESWLKDDQSKQQLLTIFEERHKPVIDLVRHHPEAVGVFLPVKTLGCVEFARVENKGAEGEKIIFSKNPLLSFKPEQIEQPLLYGLIFVLLQHLKNLSWWYKVFHRSEYLALQNALVELSTQQGKFKQYGNFTLCEV